MLRGQACRCQLEEVEDVMVPLGPSGFPSVGWLEEIHDELDAPWVTEGNVLLGRLCCCAEQVGPWLPG